MKRKIAWCFGFLLVTVVAGAQTSAPEFLVKANQMEKSDGRLLAKGHMEFRLGATLILADEATIHWMPGGDEFEIHPTGNVVVKVAKPKSLWPE